MLFSSGSHQAFPIVFLPKLLTFGLLALLCWMLAQWTWLILAPQSPIAPPSAKSPADLAAARNQIAASGLFTPAVSKTQPEVNAHTLLNLKLVGVLATMPQREQSQAILNFNNKGNEVFREGSEIATGIVLHQIAGSYVVIRRQGNLERVEFTELSSGISQPTTFSLESQFHGGSVISVSRESINRGVVEAGQLNQFAVTPGAGIVIEQVQRGSLAQKLGLQSGDVITSVNGEKISKSEDLLRLHQKFNQAGKVVLGGSRKGAAFTQAYVVNP